jgi:hypothetical protein
VTVQPPHRGAATLAVALNLEPFRSHRQPDGGLNKVVEHHLRAIAEADARKDRRTPRLHLEIRHRGEGVQPVRRSRSRPRTMRP